MPTVPITGTRQLLTGNAPKPTETEMLMALAEMHGMNRLGNAELSQPSADPNARRAAGNKRSTSPLR